MRKASLGLWTVVCTPRDDPYSKYSHIQGLAALAKISHRISLLAGVPSLSHGYLAGKAEDELRIALVVSALD
jgi:hypothetical protein